MLAAAKAQLPTREALMASRKVSKARKGFRAVVTWGDGFKDRRLYRNYTEAKDGARAHADAVIDWLAAQA